MQDHRTLTTRELDADSLAKAYPILEAVLGRDAMVEWIRFMSRRAGSGNGEGSGRGILAVEDHKGYILGLFAYRVVEDAIHGRSLDCENFAVPDLVRSSLTFKSLIDAAERMARLYGCRHLGVSITTTEPRGTLAEPMRDCLEQRAFAFDSIRFSKTLAPREASGEVGPVDAP
jgi:hypothetical protein